MGLFVAGGLVVFDWGQNTHVTLTAEFSGKTGGEKMIEFTGSQDSDVRVKQQEHVIVLCIDCGCFHVLTHPRDH